MAANFVGTWHLEKSENFDSYMEAVGVNAELAKLASQAKPSLTFSVDGDTWSLKTETPFKTHVVEFKIGQEFEETTADDRKMKSTFTLEGDSKLHQDQKGAVPSTIVREIVGGKLVVTCTAKNIVSVRHYTKA